MEEDQSARAMEEMEVPDYVPPMLAGGGALYVSSVGGTASGSSGQRRGSAAQELSRGAWLWDAAGTCDDSLERASGGNDDLASRALGFAGTAAGSNDWRRCAACYLWAYLLGTPAWPLLFNAWSGYTSVLREGHDDCKPNEDDFHVLTRIAAHNGAPALHRMQAEFTLGFLQQANPSASRQWYMAALNTAEAMGWAELDNKVLLPAGSRFEATPVHAVVDGLVDHASANLATMPEPRQTIAKDGVIELTHNSLVYEMTYFEIATRQLQQSLAEEGDTNPVEPDVGFQARRSFSHTRAQEGGRHAHMCMHMHRLSCHSRSSRHASATCTAACSPRKMRRARGRGPGLGRPATHSWT